jgi:hypothetical protein
MKAPPRWASKQLQKEAKKAAAIFREARLAPTQAWKTHVEAAIKRFEQLFEILGQLAPGKITDAAVAKAFREDLLDALRYLAGSPISADDLQVVADLPSLAPGVIGSDEAKARRAFDVIRQVIDPYRFPWVNGNREPTEMERSAALLASSVLLASSTLGTERRSVGKNEQEDAVMNYLIKLGFKRVPAQPINTIMNAPAEGEFCSECMLGNRKADIVVRLHDTRIMPIECKVSNSATNSVKRINNDAAAKAVRWTADFGDKQVVPTAVISGVYKVQNLLQAQQSNLTLFWAHDLKMLGKFIASTGPDRSHV